MHIAHGHTVDLPEYSNNFEKCHILYSIFSQTGRSETSFRLSARASDRHSANHMKSKLEMDLLLTNARYI